MMDDNEGFADTFPTCPNSGIGKASGGRYARNKSFKADHMEYDSAMHIDVNSVQLYGIFCGFNGGSTVSKLTMNRMVFEVFQSEQPITKMLHPNEVCISLKRKFENVAKWYTEKVMGDMLTRRLMLKESESDHTDELSEINQKIRQGTTAILILKIDHDVYVLNCGTSMALAITGDPSYPVIKLNEFLHDTDNPEEANRLSDLGVKPSAVFRPTRAIGNFDRSIYYNEDEHLVDATSSPIISIPDVYHYVIEDIWKSLVIISDGVVQNLKEFNVEDIPIEVHERLREDHTVQSTAQSLVDTFARRHQDAYTRNADEKSEGLSNKREEMTVIYIKLQDTDYYEDINSTSNNSTLENSQPMVEDGPYEPYVDLEEVDPNMVREIAKFLLAEEPSQSTKF